MLKFCKTVDILVVLASGVAAFLTSCSQLTKKRAKGILGIPPVGVVNCR